MHTVRFDGTLLGQSFQQAGHGLVGVLLACGPDTLVLPDVFLGKGLPGSILASEDGFAQGHAE